MCEYTMASDTCDTTKAALLEMYHLGTCYKCKYQTTTKTCWVKNSCHGAQKPARQQALQVIQMHTELVITPSTEKFVSSHFI